MVRVPGMVGPLLVGAVGLTGVFMVATHSPHEPGNYPLCPSIYLTGTYCPGCGAMRAVHDLAHLNVAGAWGMNPLVVVAAPYLVWAWIRWLGRTAQWWERRRLAPAWVLYTLVGFVAAFWIARNVDALHPYLGPG